MRGLGSRLLCTLQSSASAAQTQQLRPHLRRGSEPCAKAVHIARISTLGSRHPGGGFYPHNWNIMYVWNARTSTLLRDWLLLQLRRGITTDDQATLHLAELRGAAASGLKVGQMPTAYAAAFISVSPSRGFYPRLTRPLHSAAHVLHCKGPECTTWCSAFRQADEDVQSHVATGHSRDGGTQPWQLLISTAAHKKSGVGTVPRPLFSTVLCERALRRERTDLSVRRRKKVPCMFRGIDGDNAALQRAFPPTENIPLARRLKTFSEGVSW